MSVSYKKLWKKLVDYNLNKTQLRDMAKISNQTLSKLSKNQYVSMEVIDRICECLDCDIKDIVERKDKITDCPETDLKIVSLFSGIGGFESGILSSSMKASVVFASEIEKFAKASYLANFPNHQLFGDITKISEKEIPNHDILVAGFPCQAFSIAGKRDGFNDTRGTLFFDVARILKEKSPKIVLLENVENLINHDKSNTIRTILDILNKLGYTIDFTIINSSEMGVPQSRSRTFIIGIRHFQKENYEVDERSVKINKLKQELNEKSNFNSFNFFNNMRKIDDFKTIENILDPVVDEKYYFETPKIKEFLLKIKIKEINSERKIIRLFDLPKNIHNDQERQRRVHSIRGISPTLLARSDTTKILVNEDGQMRIRKLTPIENLRTQGFDDSFIENLKSIGVSDTQLYKQAGNAVSPPVIKEIFNHLNDFLLKLESKGE
ncbi:DNA (cytosine-5-)-methyltransferase [Streptococcus pluranimalium]|uniref:DNA (cytosine-5-)-methyltransferase n=1 Tax=Streptococcus pluranimalium TaxID=82348 RepID=UPI0039FC34F2